jgi:hypothetical protein
MAYGVNASGHYRTTAISFFDWSNRDKISALFFTVCVPQIDISTIFVQRGFTGGIL